MTPLPECCQAADNAPEFCPNHRPDVPPERSCERCNPPLNQGTKLDAPAPAVLDPAVLLGLGPCDCVCHRAESEPPRTRRPIWKRHAQ